ncbi:hypothetical protein BpHYR1_033015 [Brachionus plicatilis]|uniref:Uncharacterized protein n=1 Tax=Brachionus plicatilis TaxID=10195 RepID=A0A3M7S581_BRAPC|nr:hypothetical protein BpHYR1_033015 [Brachionus plicatilis]
MPLKIIWTFKKFILDFVGQISSHFKIINRISNRITKLQKTNIIKLKKLFFIKSINYFFDNAPLLDFGGLPRFRTHTNSLTSSSNGV